MTKHEWAKMWLEERDEEVALDMWYKADVLARAKELDLKITKEEAGQIVFMMDKRLDANVGFNWDFVDYWIERIISERKATA